MAQHVLNFLETSFPVVRERLWVSIGFLMSFRNFLCPKSPRLRQESERGCPVHHRAYLTPQRDRDTSPLRTEGTQGWRTAPTPKRTDPLTPPTVHDSTFVYICPRRPVGITHLSDYPLRLSTVSTVSSPDDNNRNNSTVIRITMTIIKRRSDWGSLLDLKGVHRRL